MNNCGFTPEEAKAIEANYHSLYQVSKAWVDNEIKKASERGYGIGAFGLRILTPVLAKTVYGNKSTPQAAAKEARTLGNALSGQSYGLLTCRAANEFAERVWALPNAHEHKIALQIHQRWI